MLISQMRPAERRLFVRGFIDGRADRTPYLDARARGWEYFGGWLDGRSRGKALTPYGARCWLKDVGALRPTTTGELS